MRRGTSSTDTQRFWQRSESASMVAGLTLALGISSVARATPDARQLHEFLRALHSGDPAADITRDGVVDERDLAAYFDQRHEPGAAPVDGGLPGTLLDVPIVFVSRQILDEGSVYWAPPRDMPGVGPHSRVRPAPPGKLLIREPSGEVRTLIDGGAPSPETFNLIDVNGPNVSYDGQTIVFSGLPAGQYDPRPARSLGAWRIFTINVDGTNLRQITDSSMILDLNQFRNAGPGLAGYDDFDPVFLPDGRICFSSTRTPGFAQYSGVRTSDLWVVRPDGADLHRITSERNGADRPLVDPLTGRIVYSRWWRNHRFPLDSMQTVVYEPGNPVQGYAQHDGLTTDRDNHVAAPGMWRNYWQPITIFPDGMDIRLYSGRFRSEPDNHYYGGSFAPDGSALFGNFFPMFNMTEAGGFGGVRRWTRGAEPWAHVVGITSMTLEYVNPSNPTSYGVFVGEYAAEPEALAGGRIVVSIAPDIGQDYGLWVMDADGANREALLDFAGTSELRARVVAPRPIPPIHRDQYRDDPNMARPNPLPPLGEGPYDPEGGFFFYSFNIYANAPVDTDIVSAPAVGSAQTIRFFVDHQRTSPGSYPNLDWPIQIAEAPVRYDGAVTVFGMPGNIPMFEQLRSADPDYRVPTTNGPYVDGSGQVAGHNFSPAGRSATCVGCHAGHTLIPVPNNPLEARFYNLAPGATLTVSSERDPAYTAGLIDRKALKGEIWRYWNSAPGSPQDGQWVRLTFRVPVFVRDVVLYNPRFGDEANSTIQVHAATVTLSADAQGDLPVAQQTAGPLSVDGTRLRFPQTRARSVLVRLDDVSGTFYGMEIAALAEIEVIAQGAPPLVPPPTGNIGEGD